jgi:hypothetical protein
VNGLPVVVFVDDRFECVMVAPTRDTALAWAAGASFGAKAYAEAGQRFVAIVVGASAQSVPAAMMWVKHELDEEMVTVERVSPCGCS